MKVTVQEVLDVLRIVGYDRTDDLAERISKHGIAPAEGMALVPIESTSVMDIVAMERHDISRELASDIWDTMLAAAKDKP